jgi:hypothetical protein
MASDLPSRVEITILTSPRGPGPRLSVVVAAAVTVAIAAAATIILAPQHGHRPHSLVAVTPRSAGPDPIAPAYRYPFRCLTFTVAASDPAYARVALGRAGACRTAAHWVPAIMHRVDGRWHPVLVLGTQPCPATTLPAAVQAELGVCLSGRHPHPFPRA